MSNYNWELSFGFYPGIVVGFRTYPPTTEDGVTNHVFYLPFIDLCLTVQRATDE
jgi:hypothetical protein